MLGSTPRNRWVIPISGFGRDGSQWTVAPGDQQQVAEGARRTPRHDHETKEKQHASEEDRRARQGAAQAGAATPALRRSVPPWAARREHHGSSARRWQRPDRSARQRHPGRDHDHEDRSFTFITKTPPAAELIRRPPVCRRLRASRTRRRSAKLTGTRCARSPRPSCRPQRQRHRGGDEDRRGHRPLDGRHDRH